MACVWAWALQGVWERVVVCARSQPPDTGGIRSGRDEDSETEPSPKAAVAGSAKEETAQDKPAAIASLPIPAAAAPDQVQSSQSKTFMGGTYALGQRWGNG